MDRAFSSFSIIDYDVVKQQLIEWLGKYPVACFLDNHNYQSKYNSYNCLAGVGATQIIQSYSGSDIDHSAFVETANDWIFGHFNYDFNDSRQRISSDKPDDNGFPSFCLFVPQFVVQLTHEEITIGVVNGDAEMVLNEILKQEILPTNSYNITFKNRINKEEYIRTINSLKDHIKRGDCYEINFCQEFFAENIKVNPTDLYKQLTSISPNPFSAFYKLDENYVLCASPERYLKKTRNLIASQPIKGTGKRDLNDPIQDQKNKELLETSEKDKRENVIVVDLVRNDLSKICKEGSVVVEELCRVYPFPSVYQMISTVTGELKPATGFFEIIEATFPMGSMTGAPKKKVMELIEKYEKTRRGIYSGTIGYISPNKDFDFNVVIRSLVYNAGASYLSYHVGGGITYQSIAEQEYEECLTKASAFFKIFSGK